MTRCLYAASATISFCSPQDLTIIRCWICAFWAPLRGGEFERLSWDSRLHTTITVYIPLAIFVIVLLFPFYWMTITAFKPDSEMYDYKQYNPFWVHSPTLHNIEVLLFETNYPRWLTTTMA